MPTFASHDGLEINYIDEGAGEPILLVHGFASSCTELEGPASSTPVAGAAGRGLELARDGEGKRRTARGGRLERLSPRYSVSHDLWSRGYRPSRARRSTTPVGGHQDRTHIRR